MTEATPATTGSENPAPVVFDPRRKHVPVFAALGTEVRWSIIQLLADGRPRNISEIREVAGTTAENISKQLRVLLDAGLLDNRPGEDRRQSIFFLPSAYRATPGILDFGCCTVRLRKD